MYLCNNLSIYLSKNLSTYNLYIYLYLGMYEPKSVGVTSDIAHLYPEATFIGKVISSQFFLSHDILKGVTMRAIFSNPAG